jgi:hypothetical protein
MLIGSGAPIRSIRAEVDRICRIAGVAPAHDYALFSMTIRVDRFRRR